MAERVLVVAAHPDDEVLGIGGTLARHIACGDAVHILILAEGASSRGPGGRSAAIASEVAALMDAACAAARIIGAAEPSFAALPDQRMDELPLLDIVKRVEQAVADVAPTIVYTHHAGDLNLDHRIACEAVLTACRPLPRASARAIVTFETPSASEWAGPLGRAFAPNRFVDIEAYLELKLRALDAYAREMRPFPHARSREAIVALARRRGASVGVRAAEAFVVLREIVL